MILYLHHNVIAKNDINERLSFLIDTNIDKLTLRLRASVTKIDCPGFVWLLVTLKS